MFHHCSRACLGALLLSISALGHGQTTSPATRQEAEHPAFAKVFATSNRAVVEVGTLTLARNEESESPPLELGASGAFADQLAKPFQIRLSGGSRDQASGVILDAGGLILTSAHVIANTDEVQVQLADGRRFAADVVGIDKRTDIGLLKIQATGLPTALFGDSSTLAPGDRVAAIGSPFGFNNSVTVGVVSATERYLAGAGDIPFVQTDVAINAGNSGSPLFNERGEVVAINSMIFSESGGFMGLSFAVPINLALSVAGQLRDHGHVRRSKLGADFQELTPALAQSFGALDSKGALIVRIERRSPAETIGLKRGDVVRMVDSETIARASDLLRTLSAKVPGTRVRLGVLRQGRPLFLSPTLEDDKSLRDAHATRVRQAWGDGLGLRLVELTPAQMKFLDIDNGLLVRESAGAARTEGIQTNDVVIAINDLPVVHVADYAHVLAAMAPDRLASLLVLRDKSLAYVPVKLPALDARQDTQ